MAHIDNVKRELQRRLHGRQMQYARYGISADPAIMMEIDDLQILLRMVDAVYQARANDLDDTAVRDLFGKKATGYMLTIDEEE